MFSISINKKVNKVNCFVISSYCGVSYNIQIINSFYVMTWLSVIRKITFLNTEKYSY